MRNSTRQPKGQALPEYALCIALICIVSFTALYFLSDSISNTMNELSTFISNMSTSPP